MIAIIIPAFDEAALLPGTLYVLARQDAAHKSS